MPKSSVKIRPVKRSRRLGIKVVAKADKYISRRPYPPGAHGQSRRIKQSDYALQLQEKQRAKFIYGIRERQFAKIFNLASKSRQSTGERLMQNLELRLDNVVYRSGFAATRNHARQLISHGHIKLNSKAADISSIICKKGDIITPSRTDKFKFCDTEETNWLKINRKKAAAEVIKVPSRNDITTEIDEQLIVEYYSR